jgi:hypothetical protein
LQICVDVVDMRVCHDVPVIIEAPNPITVIPR